jgi:hypothetical protein
MTEDPVMWCLANKRIVPQCIHSYPNSRNLWGDQNWISCPYRVQSRALTRRGPASTGESTSSLLSGTIVGSGGLSRVQSIYGGTSEIMKTIIARDVTGLRA